MRLGFKEGKLRLPRYGGGVMSTSRERCVILYEVTSEHRLSSRITKSVFDFGIVSV